MKEEYLHYLWKFRLLPADRLFTVDGKKIEIHHPGQHNLHAGPDFSNAMISIGDTRWAGDVEIHVKSSDWTAHGHTNDSNYRPVVLHVVWENDHPVKIGTYLLPALELKNIADPSQFDLLKDWHERSSEIPCRDSLPGMDQLIWRAAVDRMAAARLESKTIQVVEVLKETRSDWEETFFRLLCVGFGMKINAEPFKEFGRRLPYRLLRRQRSSSLGVEALIFGAAGFLQREVKDEYHNALIREFSYLGKMHGIIPLGENHWHFMRSRPVNFPTPRLAQLAALIRKHENLFDTFISAASEEELCTVLNIETDPYWDNHYRFGEKTILSKQKLPGRLLARHLIINTLAPVLFALGKTRQQPEWTEKAFYLLETTGAEENAVVKRWRRTGQELNSALDTQGAIELYNHHCVLKNCLNCSIGAHLLKKSANHV